MNTAERKEVKRAKTLLLAGDRSSALTILRALEAPHRSANDPAGQLILAFVTFRCERLHTDDLPAHVCVTRQKATEIQRTHQTDRGQGTLYPLCDSRTCDQGRAIRQSLDPNARTVWRGEGPGKRLRQRERTQGVNSQRAARERQRRSGMLEVVPTLDSVPPEEEGDAC